MLDTDHGMINNTPGSRFIKKKYFPLFSLFTECGLVFLHPRAESLDLGVELVGHFHVPFWSRHVESKHVSHVLHSMGAALLEIIRVDLKVQCRYMIMN